MDAEGRAKKRPHFYDRRPMVVNRPNRTFHAEQYDQAVRKATFDSSVWYVIRHPTLGGGMMITCQYCCCAGQLDMDMDTDYCLVFQWTGCFFSCHCPFVGCPRPSPSPQAPGCPKKPQIGGDGLRLAFRRSIPFHECLRIPGFWGLEPPTVDTGSKCEAWGWGGEVSW